jgi:hypothetical protein
MNKVLFFFCNLIVFAGILILFTTSILNKVLPTLGYVAYQAATAGSYSPSDYVMNFNVINLFAILLIIIGLVTGYKIYKKSL